MKRFVVGILLSFMIVVRGVSNEGATNKPPPTTTTTTTTNVSPPTTTSILPAPTTASTVLETSSPTISTVIATITTTETPPTASTLPTTTTSASVPPTTTSTVHPTIASTVHPTDTTAAVPPTTSAGIPTNTAFTAPITSASTQPIISDSTLTSSLARSPTSSSQLLDETPPLSNQTNQPSEYTATSPSSTRTNHLSSQQSFVTNTKSTSATSKSNSSTSTLQPPRPGTEISALLPLDATPTLTSTNNYTTGNTSRHQHSGSTPLPPQGGTVPTSEDGSTPDGRLLPETEELPETEKDNLFTIAVLTPYSGLGNVGLFSTAMLQMAYVDIGRETSFSGLMRRGFNVRTVWRNTDCSAFVGLHELVALWDEEDVKVFIGPACDVICEAGALLSSGWGIPMISYGCTQTTLSMKSLYPTFARTQASYSNIGPMVVKIMQYFDWDHIVMVTSTNREWDTTSDKITLYLEEANFTVIVSAFFNEEIHNDTKVEHEKRIKQLAVKTRVFMICANNKDTRDFLLHAYDMGLMKNGEYAFITMDVLLSSRFINPDSGKDESDDVDSSSYKRVHGAYEGIIDITVNLNHTEEFDRDLLTRLRNTLNTKNESGLHNYNYTMREIRNDGSTIYAMMLYEAIWLYSVALNKSLQQGVSFNDSRGIARRMMNITFQVGGNEVTIDENGDAIRNFMARNLYNGEFHNIIAYDIRTGDITIKSGKIHWPGNHTARVIGHPLCGWDGELCKYPQNNIFYILLGLGICVAVLTIISAVTWYRLKKRMSRLLSESWRIHYKDLAPQSSARAKSNFSYSKLSMAKSDKLAGGMNAAIYNGNKVAVKMLDKPNLVVSSVILEDIKNLLTIRHLNLNTFIGACVEPNHLCIVTNYCSKGSLEDILANDNIKLDSMFKLSFIHDIANGMSYLHKTAIKFHGNLNSTSVLVDGRWSCKIADFGLERILENERRAVSKILVTCENSKDVYLAPELLKEEAHKRVPTQKTDIYAFAMLLFEIMEREPPFSDHSDVNACLRRIVNTERPCYRPKISTINPELVKIVDLMHCCWDEYSGLRPSFGLVLDAINKVNKGKQVNLVDQIIERMERYADNLEEVVTERTQQLVFEQRKTDELLSRMLPRYIVDELKKGNLVQPEMYTSVTVFFSDIVGFTAMSAGSTAFEVVDFLNDLYTTFDKIIDEYDVYKVETIGDAYMVASGLPVRNGNRHAGEIATMALSMNSCLSRMHIRHRPGQTIQMRIGMHTGSVCAGVVGLKMPRYCLFGDTVNYASRMESSGLALRIHVSPDTKSTLDELGGYHLEVRGEIEMKGKGRIKTYFLLGKDGLDLEMADLKLAAPLEAHEFK